MGQPAVRVKVKVSVAGMERFLSRFRASPSLSLSLFTSSGGTNQPLP